MMLAADIYTAELNLKDGEKTWTADETGSHSNSCPTMKFEETNRIISYVSQSYLNPECFYNMSGNPVHGITC